MKRLLVVVVVLVLALALGAPAMAGGASPVASGDRLAKATGDKVVAEVTCMMINRCVKYGWQRACLKFKPVKKCLKWKKVGQKKVCAQARMIRRCAKYAPKKDRICLKFKVFKVCK